MKVVEFEAKELLKDKGLNVPSGKLVTSAEAAEAATRDLGRPVMLKAQIPVGGRMKAGGVRFAGTPAETFALTGELLGREIRGFAINSVLVEEKVTSTAEVVVGMTSLSWFRARIT